MTIEQNRTFDYRAVDNRTQSNVGLPNSCLFILRTFCTVHRAPDQSCVIYQTDYEQNRIGSSSIVFDWFENRTHSKIDVRFCSITEPNRTIDVRLGSIDFWFDFVRLPDTPGIITIRCSFNIASR